MSEWVWVDDIRSAEQLRQEVRAWTAGGTQMASVRAIDSRYEIWTCAYGFLLVDVVPDGPIGYAIHGTYVAALQAATAEVHEQETNWQRRAQNPGPPTYPR